VRTQKANKSKTVILTKSELPNITLGGGAGLSSAGLLTP
jgi:hypothetical protein